jgi:hypothetical protein
MSKHSHLIKSNVLILLFLLTAVLGCAGTNSTEQRPSSGTAATDGAVAGTFETRISCSGASTARTDRMTRCFAAGPIVGARLLTDTSETGASCRAANSWGYRNNWIWVSGNCSGLFLVTISRQ